MDKLITNELSLGLDQKLRDDLIDNFKIIQNGVDGQADKTNKQILDLLGDVPLQDQNEVTQARIDVDGSQYETLKGRLDANQETADTALAEERRTHSEVESARVNGVGHTYSSIKTRLDEQETDLTQSMNEKISQISSIPETFANLSALKAAYPNGRTGLFVTADTGHKYIWVNNTWTDAGVYQSVGISDEQKLTVHQFGFNADNLVQNGFFSTLDGVISWQDAQLSLTNFFNKHWATAISSESKGAQGLGLMVKDEVIESWLEQSFAVLDLEFDVISSHPISLYVQCQYFKDSTEYDDLLKIVVLKPNVMSHEKFSVIKDPSLIGDKINITVTDQEAEPINFSISNFKITPKGNINE